MNNYRKCNATIDAERLKLFSERLPLLADKDLKAAQRAGLRAVGNRTLREMRKLVVQDIPGAKLAPGATKRKRGSASPYGSAIYGDVPLSKGGRVYVKKNGSAVTISNMEPPLLRMFTAGAPARSTKRGYWRGDLMRKNNGEGGNYVRLAGQIVAPYAGAMLDEIIVKQIERKFKKIGYDL